MGNPREDFDKKQEQAEEGESESEARPFEKERKKCFSIANEKA